MILFSFIFLFDGSVKLFVCFFFFFWGVVVVVVYTAFDIMF